MKVEELIKLLKTMPQDSYVQLECSSCGYLTDAYCAKDEEDHIVIIS